MKRKIGKIYNKPIVEGNKNLVTKNEVHKSELSGGGNKSNLIYINRPINGSLQLGWFAYTFKGILNTKLQIFPSTFNNQIANNAIAMSFDLSAKVTAMDDISKIVTVEEALKNLTYGGKTLLDILIENQISEEEFYNLNV